MTPNPHPASLAPAASARRRAIAAVGLTAAVVIGATAACNPLPRQVVCGPSSAVVARVIDGDTVELDTGDTVRYLLVDTPEITGDAPDCFGDEARAENAALVEGRRVALTYDADDADDCEDDFGRLLAYVTVDGVDVNAHLVAEGFACALVVPPAGADRADEFISLEVVAEFDGRGMWSACPERPCD